MDGDLSLGSGSAGCNLESIDHAVAAPEIGVTHVDAYLHTSGNAVDGSRKHIADAYGCDRVDSAAGFCSVFESEDELGCRAECIAAIGHQGATRVATGALNREVQTCGSGNAFDNTKRYALPLK